MRESLSLHLALFRKQRAQIAEALDTSSRAFRAYEARYQRRTRGFRRPLTREEVAAQVRAADIVYVGDYHTLRSAQATFVTLARAAECSGRRVVIALEFVESRHQSNVDAYLRGTLGEAAFFRRLGHGGQGFDLSSGFKPIFKHARRRGISIVGIDRVAQGMRALRTRDEHAAELIAREAAAIDHPIIMVLIGQYHIAPCHLPAQVRRRIDRRDLIVYQNCEGVYWSLLKERRAGHVPAVEIRPGEVCVNNATPIACQQTFLDYLEAEAGEPLSGA